MTLPNEIFNRRYVYIGVAATTFSAIIYGIGIAGDVQEDDFFGIFVFNYLIAAIYFFALVFSGNLKKENNGLVHFLQSLILLLISAYSLNHTLPVFELSANWLSVLLIALVVSYNMLSLWDIIPGILRHLSSFIMGIGLVLFLYLSIYLIPLYPVSLLGMLALGISIHSFVPALLLGFTLKWFVYKAGQFPGIRLSMLCGAGVAVVSVIIFSWQWYKIDRFVAAKYQHSLIAENTELPSWIKVAEELPHNWLTEQYLKGELVYTLAENNRWLSWGLPSRNFDEVRRHDPLIWIASLTSAAAPISEQDRIKILESSFDARHKTQDRLWRGDNLSTTNVIANIRIWPQLRLAYTEQTITVANKKERHRWRNSEEAIYTFHLPEGGVVTALSLWINGKEQKGILTTKGKADSAYRQIVGVESRDPSVVHWQEGNTVSVRVFPVLSMENRIFKIGITAPLTVADGKLKYESIYFDGPPTEDAQEIVQVDWAQKPADIKMDGFTSSGNNRFIKERRYKRKWDIEFNAGAVEAGTFSFNHYAYKLNVYRPTYRAREFKEVYLDINNSWTRKEFDKVIAAIGNKAVYVFNTELVKLEKDNRDALFQQLHQKHFSLFPLQEIKSPSSALLISKGTEQSPNLKDLKGSEFAEKLELWISKNEPLPVFNMGHLLNPYLKSLKEHRIFLYGQGDVALLEQLMEQSKFFTSAENENNIVIDNAAIMLTRSKDTGGIGNAPDHLLRIFAYNHLLQQLNHKIFTNQESDARLVGIAQEANIVSPLSSLVVLETQADYERFDIKASKNSLQNASMKSKGAVPEPQEWALIIGAILLMIWLSHKHKFGKIFTRL